jgi:hypothetical protein
MKLAQDKVLIHSKDTLVYKFLKNLKNLLNSTIFAIQKLAECQMNQSKIIAKSGV